MELKRGTIAHLQEHIAFKIKERGFADETLQERLVLLMEEVGEVARAARKLTNMNVNTKTERVTDFGEEIADVINMIFAVGIEAGIDIEAAFIAKNKKVDERFYKRGGAG